MPEFGTIKLDCRHLTAIPEDVFKHPALTSLSLFQNELTQIPDALWRLAALETLNLGDNRDRKSTRLNSSHG